MDRFIKYRPKTLSSKNVTEKRPKSFSLRGGFSFNLPRRGAADRMLLAEGLEGEVAQRASGHAGDGHRGAPGEHKQHGQPQRHRPGPEAAT